MRHTKMVEVPARTEEQFDKITCDLCGTSTLEDGNWSKFYGDVRKTRVEIEQGSDFPGYSETQVLGVDICPECFKTKLVPWLKDQGAELRFIKSVEWSQ